MRRALIFTWNVRLVFSYCQELLFLLSNNPCRYRFKKFMWTKSKRNINVCMSWCNSSEKSSFFVSVDSSCVAFLTTSIRDKWCGAQFKSWRKIYWQKETIPFHETQASSLCFMFTVFFFSNRPVLTSWSKHLLVIISCLCWKIWDHSLCVNLHLQNRVNLRYSFHSIPFINENAFLNSCRLIT